MDSLPVAMALLMKRLSWTYIQMNTDMIIILHFKTRWEAVNTTLAADHVRKLLFL